ncbi:hypothetical protein E0K83_09520 [Gramella sp. BOM4]|nr:hypothetical protein [Christiangramia bathymodioli]
MQRLLKNLILTLCLLMMTEGLAHPTGNMVRSGDYVLWSYVNPVDDDQHHACIMIWKPGIQPSVLITSEYPASDFMLSAQGEDIYIIERRFIESSNGFEIRILKTQPEGLPTEIWPWMKDHWRIGEGGFFMLSEDQVVFGRYPDIYSLHKGKTPIKYFEFTEPVKRIRNLEKDRLLLLGDNSCWLTDHQGTILETWKNITKKEVSNAPLDRNQVFDADLQNDELLLAYWGNRSFITIENGAQREILKLDGNFVPHWVSFYDDMKLLFASEMFMEGQNPQPKLILYQTDEYSEIIWE